MITSKSSSKTEDPETVQNTSAKRKVTFIIPFATPGSGKSFCWDAIKEHLETLSNWSFTDVSSDEIRG